MKKLLLLLFFCQVALSGFASHISGADFYCRYVGYIAATSSQRYEVTLKLYRNNSPISTALSASYPMVVWRNSVSSPDSFTRYPTSSTCWTLDTFLNRTRIISLPCGGIGSGIQEGIYTMSLGGNPAYLDLPDDTLDYFIGWGSSGRVNTVLNIANPGNAGLSCYSKIPKNNIYKNSNPVYMNSPVADFCVGKTSYFNLNAYDIDGDSLSFAIVQPYSALGGNTCNNPWCPKPPAYVYTANPIPNPSGYNFPNAPFGTASSVSINAATGEVTVMPANIGVYCIAVAVSEYRKINGRYVFLCETRRDIQITVGNICSNAAPVLSSIVPIKNANTTVNQVVKAGDTLCFNVKFKDADAGDSLFVFYSGPIFDGSAGVAAPFASLSKDTGIDSVTTSFCWSTKTAHIRPMPYIFTISVLDNHCSITQKTFTVLVNSTVVDSVPIANFTATKVNTYIDTVVQLYDLSLYLPTLWKWSINRSAFSFVNSTSSTSQSPFVIFTDTGYYSVKLFCSNTHGADSLTKTNYIFVSRVTGINNYNQFSGIRIYPNPAGNQLRITPDSYRDYELRDDRKFVIYTIQGQLIQDGLLTGKETSIDISNLAGGIYFIRVGGFTGKFVKE